jgi:Xaa-Pro aminopeptidase
MKYSRTLFLLPFAILLQAHNHPVYSQDTPEQKYFDWTSMPFSKETYQERRNNLIDELRKSGGGIFLAPARDGYSRGETFRQLNDFMYFTGLEFPNSVLAINVDQGKVILFGPARDRRFESTSRKNDFPGRPLIDDPDINAMSGIEDFRNIETLDETIKKWISQGKVFKVNKGRSGRIDSIHTGFTTTFTPEQMLIYHLSNEYEMNIFNAYNEIATLRMIKSDEEISNIRNAINITIVAITQAAGYIADGVEERRLEAELEAVYKRSGSPRMGFSSIIKSGPNSLWPWRILASHYDRRNRTMKDGDLVIFDVGSEYEYYTSDVGRTFPVSGKFTNEQKQILEMEVSVSEAIIKAVKPGLTFSDLKKIAQSAIPPDQLKYMQTGLFYGHHIGMSSGDPNIADAKLKPGMIFTIEPWYYNHDLGISVFTEDVVLVTENGAEVLTAELTRSPNELEKMVKRNRK